MGKNVRWTHSGAAAAVLLALGIALAAPAASAAQPFNPGDFQVNTQPSGGGPGGPGGPGGGPPGGPGGAGTNSCTVTSGPNAGTTFDPATGPGAIFSTSGGPPQTFTMTCGFTSSSAQSNQPMNGTVTNTVLKLTGTIAMVCDQSQTTGANWTATFTPTPPGSNQSPFVSTAFSTSVKGYQACTWAMSFIDGSKLAGSIEQVMQSAPQGTLSNGMYTMVVTNSARVHVTGGAGVFAGVSGDARFANSQTVSIPLPGSQQAQNGPGGSNPPPNGPGTPPSGTGGQLRTRLSSGLAPRAVLESFVARAAKAGASQMKGMHLAKTGGVARIVSPPAERRSQANGVRPFGTGPDHKRLEVVSVATAPGATCTLRAGRGRHVATIATAKTVTGQWVSKVTARTVRSRLHVGTGVVVQLVVSCELSATRTVVAKQRVRLAP